MAGATAATVPSNAPSRISAIRCPVQRVLAAYLTTIEDLFTEHFAPVAPSHRFVRPAGDATTAPARVRAEMRMPALGCVVHLGLDLGLGTHALHGCESGYTEITELRLLHYQTTSKARELFQALIADRSEVGKFLARRYKEILAAARADAEGLVPVITRPAGPAPRAPVAERREEAPASVPAPAKRGGKASAKAGSRRESSAPRPVRKRAK